MVGGDPDLAARHFRVEVQPYRGLWKVPIWAWAIVDGLWLDSGFAPARVCVVRQSDQSIVNVKRLLSGWGVQATYQAITDDLNSLEVREFQARWIEG